MRFREDIPASGTPPRICTQRVNAGMRASFGDMSKLPCCIHRRNRSGTRNDVIAAGYPENRSVRTSAASAAG